MIQRRQRRVGGKHREVTLTFYAHMFDRSVKCLTGYRLINLMSVIEP